MYFHDLNAFEDWNAHISNLNFCLGESNSKIKRALEIVRKHHDQPRISGVGNYNRHPVRVARILAEEMKVIDEQSVLIALCHDLGEWSNYDIRQLKGEFSEEVFLGVSTLTWDQKGEWADFVKTIVNSDINNLVAIKIADKLDNNRAVALSGNLEDKFKAKDKTINVILPLVQKYYPEMLKAYEEVLVRLG